MGGFLYNNRNPENSFHVSNGTVITQHDASEVNQYETVTEGTYSDF